MEQHCKLTIRCLICNAALRAWTSPVHLFLVVASHLSPQLKMFSLSLKLSWTTQRFLTPYFRQPPQQIIVWTLWVGNTDVQWHCRYHLTRHQYLFLSQMENHSFTEEPSGERPVHAHTNTYARTHTHTSYLFKAGSTKAGCSGRCQVEFWIPLRVETSQPLNAFVLS